MRRKIGIMLGVALLVAGLAAPASAKKGGHPGPPSGTGLEVTVEPSNFPWANSVGDEILFDVTVTNTSGGALSGVTVQFITNFGFNGVGTFDNDATFNMADGVSWTAVLTYTVFEGDFTGLPISEQSQVTVGTVTATENEGEVSDSDDAVMTAYPVPPCDPDGEAPFTFGPNGEYTECSFTAAPESSWTLTTKLAKKPHGKSSSPSATVRDGVPGNWCNVDSSAPYTDADGAWYVADTVDFPAAADGNIVCEQGGAGGDTIPVRNADTFYLATWAGNTVTATPDGS